MTIVIFAELLNLHCFVIEFSLNPQSLICTEGAEIEILGVLHENEKKIIKRGS